MRTLVDFTTEKSNEGVFSFPPSLDVIVNLARIMGTAFISLTRRQACRVPQRDPRHGVLMPPVVAAGDG